MFVGGLVSKDLARLEMRDGKVVHEERLFKKELGKRIRTVVNGPDGALYLLTDESRRADPPRGAGRAESAAATPRAMQMRRIAGAAGL